MSRSNCIPSQNQTNMFFRNVVTDSYSGMYSAASFVRRAMTGIWRLFIACRLNVQGCAVTYDVGKCEDTTRHLWLGNVQVSLSSNKSSCLLCIHLVLRPSEQLLRTSSFTPQNNFSAPVYVYCERTSSFRQSAHLISRFSCFCSNIVPVVWNSEVMGYLKLKRILILTLSMTPVPRHIAIGRVNEI